METENIKKYFLQNIKNILKPPAANLRYPFIVPGAGYMSELWGWDAYWVALALRKAFGVFDESELERAGISRETAIAHMRGSVLDFLDSQQADGYIPVMTASEGLFAGFFESEYKKGIPHNQHLPFLCRFALLASEFSGEYDWFDMDKLVAYTEYFEQKQYCERSGLYFWQDDIMIGIDNNPTVFARPPASSADIFLNCFMYLEYDALYELLNKSGDGRAEHALEMREKLKDAVNSEMWDERDGIYYSQDINLHRTKCVVKGVELHSGLPPHWNSVPLKIRFWGCFLPMYAGICSPERAQRMCAHLTENDDILAAFGIRTLAKNEKAYSLVKSAGNPSNWLGAIWTIANYCVYKGLCRYEKAELAEKVRGATLDLLNNSLSKYGDFFESYNPDSGAPFMHAGFLSHNLPVIDMLEKES